jgi:hypothetical protein
VTLDDETARYRAAARLALDQLDWCINYLRRIRKGQIARALDENRTAIARRLAHANEKRGS